MICHDDEMRSRGRRSWWLLAHVLAVVLLTGAGSCGGATDDVIRILGRNANRVDDVARDVPRSRLPGPVTATRDQIEAEITRLLAPVSQEDPQSARQTTKAACIAEDALEVRSLDDAVQFGVQQTNTTAGRYSTVRALVTDFYLAESSGQQARVLAVAAICQWAG